MTPTNDTHSLAFQPLIEKAKQVVWGANAAKWSVRRNWTEREWASRVPFYVYDLRKALLDLGVDPFER